MSLTLRTPMRILKEATSRGPGDAAAAAEKPQPGGRPDSQTKTKTLKKLSNTKVQRYTMSGIVVRFQFDVYLILILVLGCVLFCSHLAVELAALWGHGEEGRHEQKRGVLELTAWTTSYARVSPTAPH